MGGLTVAVIGKMPIPRLGGHLFRRFGRKSYGGESCKGWQGNTSSSNRAPRVGFGIVEPAIGGRNRAVELASFAPEK